MSATTLDTIPSIDLTKAGATRSLPVQIIQRRGQPDRPVPVSRTPKAGYPQPTSIGSDPAARRNYDIDEIIFADWSGGMGEDTYPPQTAPTSFQWSQCETRYHGLLACRPLPTLLGSGVAALATAGVRVIELGYANARLFAYAPSTKGYRLNGSTWTVVQDSGAADITGIRSHALGLAGIFIANGTNVYRSVDAATWETLAKVGLTNPSLLAIFDEKLWCLDPTSVSTPTRTLESLYSSSNASSVAYGSVTWTAGNTFIHNAKEQAVKLFTWKDPNDSGRDTLWCLTTWRLLYYDYYAQTPAWVTWFQAKRSGGALAATDCHVWGRNGNLYVAWGQDTDQLWEFTGSTIDNPDPNARGGMPLGTRVGPVRLVGNGHHLVAFGYPSSRDATSTGATLAMSDAKTFHHLLDDSTKSVLGGGVGASLCWTVLLSAGTGQVYEQPLPDESSIPQHAYGRTYDSAALTHKSAWIHGGFRNVWKNLRYVEVDCIKDNGDPGLNTGATVVVKVYNRKDHSTTTLATLTDASTFPAVCTTTGGIDFKECQIWLALTRGTATSATPLIRAVKVGYRPRPKQRYSYAVRVDLRDEAPAFQTADGLFKGYSASSLRTWLDELNDNDDSGLPDALVTFAYGGEGYSTHPRRRSITDCEVLVTAQEDPEGGDGVYLVQCNDVSAPSSG